MTQVRMILHPELHDDTLVLQREMTRWMLGVYPFHVLLQWLEFVRRKHQGTAHKWSLIESGCERSLNEFNSTAQHSQRLAPGTRTTSKPSPTTDGRPGKKITLNKNRVKLTTAAKTRCHELSLCIDFQIGKCNESSAQHTKATSRGEITVKHDCAHCGGRHSWEKCHSK
jgi:hypothetical protein